MTDKLLDLAERCEEAAGPDRELDAQIIEALGYRHTVEGSFYTGPILRYYGKGPLGEVGRLAKLTIPRFTSSLDAAMRLVPEGAYWSIDAQSVAMVGKGANPAFSPSPLIAKAAATPALALCAAALKARAASGMPLRENNEDCSRPKAGSPTLEEGDAR